MALRTVFSAAVVVTALFVTPAFPADAFNRVEFAARRGRLMEKIGDGAAVVLGPGPALTTTISGRDTTSST